jgi:enoyl-CoA hydratase/carnithine racemase
MPFRTLKYGKQDHCAIIELASPLSEPSSLAGELADVCSEIAWDEDARVVILNFDGRELKSVRPESGLGESPAGSPVEEIAKLRQPVIAAIHGDCVDLGLEVAMAADLRIGEEGARFGLTQIGQGLIPSGGGTQRLPRLIGMGKALEMVLTGELIGVEEAQRAGLVQRVVPSGKVMEQALSLARAMSSHSPLSLSYVKEALHHGLDLTLEQGLRMEMDLYLLLFSTADRKEGLSSFQEKRKPQFKGE